MAIPQTWFEIFGEGGGGPGGGPFAPLSHTHPVSNITDIASFYSALGHNHTASDVTDFSASVLGTTGVQNAVDVAHTQGSDTLLDSGNANEVTAADLRTHLDATDIHVPLDDDATGTDRVLSASKIISLISSGTAYTQAETDALLDGKQDVFTSQTANRFFSAPDGSDGAPVFRAIVAADIPALDAAKITSGEFVASRIPSLLASKISNFDTAVEANTEVALNTADRHAQNTDTALDQGGGNEITAATLTGHIADATIHFTINDVTPSSSTAYSGSRVDTLLGDKANSADVYTQGQVDTLLTGKLNVFPSQTANQVYIAPDGSDGTPGFRALVAADIPSLTAAKISDFDTQVSASSDVASNTSARHTQGTDLGLDTGGSNPVTAATIVNHIADSGIHTNINDAAASTSTVWSSTKITNELLLKSDTTHTHTLSDITDSGSLAAKNSLVLADIPTIVASKIGSEAATDGFVLTADGAGNAAWEAVAGGGSSLAGLTDVDSAATTAGFVIASSGGNYAGRALIASDIPSLTAAKVSDFDTEVSNNSDVTSNTSARHTQGSDLALDTGNANEVTAADLRSHLDNTGLHRTINDSGSAATDLWSADKISTELATKAASSHTHVAADIDSEASADGYVLTSDGAGNAAWEAGGSGVSQLSDLSDVGSVAYTTSHVLVADGADFDTRQLALADLSDAGTIASQASDAVAITGGAVDGTTIGATTPSTGSFTTLVSSSTTQLAGATFTNTVVFNNGIGMTMNNGSIVINKSGGNDLDYDLQSDSTLRWRNRHDSSEDLYWIAHDSGGTEVGTALWMRNSDLLVTIGNVNINGGSISGTDISTGSIDNVPIGQVTPAAGTFSTLAVGGVAQNLVFASPSSGTGTASFRSLVLGDLPELTAGKTTSGVFEVARIPDITLSKVTDAGSIASQDANAVAITGGSITGATSIDVSSVIESSTNIISQNYMYADRFYGNNRFIYMYTNNGAAEDCFVDFGAAAATSETISYRFGRTTTATSGYLWDIHEHDGTNDPDVRFSNYTNNWVLGNYTGRMGFGTTNPLYDFDFERQVRFKDTILLSNASEPTTGGGFAAFYVSGGEMVVKNASGTKTTISPHNPKLKWDRPTDEFTYMLNDDDPVSGIYAERDIDGLIEWAEAESGQTFKYTKRSSLRKRVSRVASRKIADRKRYEEKMISRRSV